jgi:uncharacterized membrane protein YgcG
MSRGLDCSSSPLNGVRKRLRTQRYPIAAEIVPSAPVNKSEVVAEHVETAKVPVDPYDDVSPHEFLMMMLTRRGYHAEDFYRPNLKRCRKSPHPSDLASYSKQLLAAVRSSNISDLQNFSKEGVRLTACNKFCESVVHLACRQASIEVVHLIFQHGDPDCLFMVDDKGRTPLHDAFWRKLPEVDIVSLILDQYVDLLWVKDVRGNTPLQYTQRHHWGLWRQFVTSILDQHWPIRGVPAHAQHVTHVRDPAFPGAAPSSSSVGLGLGPPLPLGPPTTTGHTMGNQGMLPLSDSALSLSSLQGPDTGLAALGLAEDAANRMAHVAARMAQQLYGSDDHDDGDRGGERKCSRGDSGSGSDSGSDNSSGSDNGSGSGGGCGGSHLDGSLGCSFSGGMGMNLNLSYGSIKQAMLDNFDSLPSESYGE